VSSQFRRWHVYSTLAVLVLSAVSSLLGLFRPGHYRDPPGLVDSYQMQDLAILVVGIPVLAIGLRYAMRVPRAAAWSGWAAWRT
jgi:hypothetical protein